MALAFFAVELFFVFAVGLAEGAAEEAEGFFGFGGGGGAGGLALEVGFQFGEFLEGFLVLFLEVAEAGGDDREFFDFVAGELLAGADFAFEGVDVFDGLAIAFEDVFELFVGGGDLFALIGAEGVEFGFEVLVHGLDALFVAFGLFGQAFFEGIVFGGEFAGVRGGEAFEGGGVVDALFPEGVTEGGAADECGDEEGDEEFERVHGSGGCESIGSKGGDE